MQSFKSFFATLLVRIAGSIDRKGRRIGAISRGKRSYSQSGEDIISSFIFDSSRIRNGVYLDIGASDPTQLNNTYYFYTQGWRGWNVDPIASNIAAFKRIRPNDRNICAGVGLETGERTFFEIAPSTLSTFDEQTALLYEAKGHPTVDRSNVKFFSVIDLFAQHDIPKNIDLLSLDIEGGEQGILSSMFAEGIFPTVIILETITYGRTLAEAKKIPGIVEFVREYGYFVHGDTFINTIFARRFLYEERLSDTEDR